MRVTKNPRFNDDAVEYVAASINEFGFKVPIVIDKNGVIVAGHTRYKAAETLGIVTEFIKRKGYRQFRGNILIDYVVYQGVCRKGYRQGHSLINLTALGLRPRGDTNGTK